MSVLRIHDLWVGWCPLLGPSLYVWVQGCPRRCPGCANQGALDEDGPARLMTPEEIAAEWRKSAGGVVLSGGEPMSQAVGLAALCRLVRQGASDTPVLLYTGYTLTEILARKDPAWLALLQATDVLVDGPFVREQVGDFPLAGSDNQRVYFLSRRVPEERLRRLPRAHVQVALDEGGRLRMVGTGVPGLDMGRLVGCLRAYGLVLEG